MSDSTPPQLAKLMTGLIGEVRALATAVQDSRETMDALTASNERLGVASKRQRRWIAVTITGLVADLALSLLFIYQHARQGELNGRFDCQAGNLSLRQDYNTRSFNAEVAKVTGQVEGLKQIRNATDRAAARAGFDQFIVASEHYLDVTTALQKDRLQHPLGTC